MIKAKRYETVILAETIGEHPVGTKGAVIEAYTTPFEAYDIEIVDDDGQTQGFLEGVLPEQINLITTPELTFAAIDLTTNGSHLKILFSDGIQVTVSAKELHPKAA
ncbi:MAG: DUF4926 domain-containing protein [Ardenticatenaceae bacterium]|nr:DUF4926 domain-containing protein [Ardenticatenaceae bacterium]